MWETKTKTIPVIVEAHGMIKKGTQKDVNEIPGNLCLVEFQKIVLNSTTHTLRRTLSLQTKHYIYIIIIIIIIIIIVLYKSHTNIFIQRYTKFFIYNTYTIQIHHDNSYQNYLIKIILILLCLNL